MINPDWPRNHTKSVWLHRSSWWFFIKESRFDVQLCKWKQSDFQKEWNGIIRNHFESLLLKVRIKDLWFGHRRSFEIIDQFGTWDLPDQKNRWPWETNSWDLIYLLRDPIYFYLSIINNLITKIEEKPKLANALIGMDEKLIFIFCKNEEEIHRNHFLFELFYNHFFSSFYILFL